MLLSTFWDLTVGKHTNMIASVYITDLWPWDGKFIYSFFACDVFWLQVFYSRSPDRVSSSIEFLLITSFIHPITELFQIYMKHNVPKLTRMKPDFFSPAIPLLFCCLRLGEPVSNQAVWAGDPVGNEGHFFLQKCLERIMLCLNRLTCHHKKDAYGWLLLFYTALALGEYFFSLTGK